MSLVQGSQTGVVSNGSWMTLDDLVALSWEIGWLLDGLGSLRKVLVVLKGGHDCFPR